MKKTLISLVVLIIIVMGLIVIFNSKRENIETNDEKINIIVSIYPIYDFTREIAGNKANVSMFLPTGVEIHDYEPTPNDIVKIENSDLFLYLGEQLEPWTEILNAGIHNKEKVIDVANNIEIIKIDEEDEDNSHEEYDTHIWLDPTKSIQMVMNIKDELCKIDKDNEEYYTKNAERYIEQLKKLDSDFKNVIQKSSKKKIAFGGPFSYSYFVKRYELEYISAYDSCGEEGEPSTRQIFNVIQEIKDMNLPVIFYKELSSANIAKTISEETKTEMLEFNSLHTITNEQLESGENYISIMYKNLENLKKALQ